MERGALRRMAMLVGAYWAGGAAAAWGAASYQVYVLHDFDRKFEGAPSNAVELYFAASLVLLAIATAPLAATLALVSRRWPLGGSVWLALLAGASQTGIDLFLPSGAPALAAWAYMTVLPALHGLAIALAGSGAPRPPADGSAP